jgi:hypothetical protein
MELLHAILLIVYVINRVIVDRSGNDCYLRHAHWKLAKVALLRGRWLRFVKRSLTLYSAQASVCKLLVVGVDRLGVGFVSSEFVDDRSRHHLLADRHWVRLVKFTYELSARSTRTDHLWLRSAILLRACAGRKSFIGLSICLLPTVYRRLLLHLSSKLPTAYFRLML